MGQYRLRLRTLRINTKKGFRLLFASTIIRSSFDKFRTSASLSPFILSLSKDRRMRKIEQTKEYEVLAHVNIKLSRRIASIFTHHFKGENVLKPDWYQYYFFSILVWRNNEVPCMQRIHYNAV